MINDIFTVLWKEIKEAFLMRGSARSELLNLLLIVGVFGVIMPLQSGAMWFTNPLLPLMWSWMPMFKSLGIITVSIAGEKENHTLETLLASRLPDQAILFGKLLTAVVYAWGLNILCYLCAAVAVNGQVKPETPLFYSADLFIGLLVFSLLINILIAALGLLVSLDSTNARQAYQKISFVMLGVFILPSLAVQFLPREIVEQVLLFFTNAGPVMVAVVGGALLIAADIILLIIAQARFKRSRLILD